jgi:hypothetical protein
VSPSDPRFGIKHGHFGFNITGTDGIMVIVEGSTNLAHTSWTPISTNTLAGGTSLFADPNPLANTSTVYRLRTP